MRASVILPVYNAASFLRTALDSLLQQSFVEFEIIAVDDGSTDASLQILNEFADRDSRIKIISRPNTGIVGALNDGVLASSGELLIRMDGDDFSHPERFKRQIRFMDAHPDVVACGSAVHLMDELSNLVDSCPRPENHSAIEADFLQGDGGAMIHPSVVIRRSAFEKVGGYRESSLWLEDLDLFLRLAEVGKLANLPDYLLHYRIHAESVNSVQSNDERMRKKNRIMAEAHQRRGSDWKPAPIKLHGSNRLENFKAWAIRSLEYGDVRVGRRYMWKVLLNDPFSIDSYRVFKLVCWSGSKLARKGKFRNKTICASDS